ncbi:MAG: DUF1284 domain-containing protein [Candidatus Methanoperedens sp.]|nr:DUF1284 domain-containing protein [Candidatus Methanoperedens sp.]
MINEIHPKNDLKSFLRGHHLICLYFFRGEGYSQDFVKNLYEVIKKENIEIITGADDVCGKCPYLEDDKCRSSDYTDEKIHLQDHKALRLLGLNPGMIVDRKMIASKLPGIIEEWKAEFCFSCGYRKVCFNE